MLQSSKMNTKFSLTLILILLTSTALTGCNLPFGRAPELPQIPPTQDLNLLATITQQALEHSIQETQTAPTPAATETITLTPLPLETISPTSDTLPAPPSEIKFKSGGTMAYLKGDLKAGEQQTFTLEAGQGQTLIAVVSSETNQAYFEIRDLDGGTTLTPFSEGASSKSLQLPRSGVYQVTLTSPVDLDYFLSLEVPAIVNMAAGDNPKTVPGYLDVLDQFHPAAPTRVRYQIELEAGAKFDVQLSSPSLEGLSLALIGANDGQPYQRYEVQSSSINDFVVPVSQGYYLDVYSISGDSSDFSLQIEVVE
jgi:hypothetical protein